MEVTVKLDDMDLIFEVSVRRDGYTDGDGGRFMFNVFEAEKLERVIDDNGDVEMEDRIKNKFFEKYKYQAEELAEEKYNAEN